MPIKADLLPVGNGEAGAAMSRNSSSLTAAGLSNGVGGAKKSYSKRRQQQEAAAKLEQAIEQNAQQATSSMLADDPELDLSNEAAAVAAAVVSKPAKSQLNMHEKIEGGEQQITVSSI